jgi:hypothetical protein
MTWELFRRDSFFTARVWDRGGGPVKSKGSSDGEGGGSGKLRSTTGGSVFITNLRPFPIDLRLLELAGLRAFARRDVTYTSRGGVKRSAGYWYGVPECLLDEVEVAGMCSVTPL